MKISILWEEKILKAISLFSGGLDSQLAVRLMQEQNIEVTALNFVSPFFGGGEELEKAAAALKIPILFPEVGNEYLELLHNPAHGFGKNCNPCIDCHAFMLHKAGELMQELGADFLITGEVLGQRPMSQNRNALRQVEKASGLTGMILRPLSALKLDETVPEKNGWVDRSRLMDIQGLSRGRQMELADQLGLKEYPTPAGGCLLTQESTAKRIWKYFEFRPGLKELNELLILKAGRHFYLNENALLVVGRHQADNTLLADIACPKDIFVKVSNNPGPLALLRSTQGLSDEVLQQAARVVSRYSDSKNDPEAPVKFLNAGMEEFKNMTVVPYKPDEIPSYVN